MRELFKVTGVSASRQELDDLQRQLGSVLPDAYLTFLRETNGAEWCIHDIDEDCLNFWKAHEVPELNVAYEIQLWLPDVLAIASDGGDRAIILDRTTPDPNYWPLFRVEFGALCREGFEPVAKNFNDWVQREFRLPSKS